MVSVQYVYVRTIIGGWKREGEKRDRKKKLNENDIGMWEGMRGFEEKGRLKGGTI